MLIYEVYDAKTGIGEFQGTAREIADKYDVSESAIYHYKNRCKMKRKYYIRTIGERKTQKQPIKEIKKSKYQQTLEYIMLHLERYGNVYCPEPPNKYIQELKDNGFNVKVNMYRTYDEEFVINVPGNKNKGKYEIDYILTLIKE